MAYADRFDDYSASSRRSSTRARELLAPRARSTSTSTTARPTTCKVALDEIFGRDCFLNEIIWAYDYGAKPTRRWPAKHDTILVYVRDREPATCSMPTRSSASPTWRPGSSGRRRRRAASARPTPGGTRSSPTSGAERTGYPTQKPEGVVRRIVAASSRPGGWCLDFFAGSGTLGAVCAALGRRYVLVDSNPQAVAVMRARLGH